VPSELRLETAFLPAGEAGAGLPTGGGVVVAVEMGTALK
jgi:hypothetical protein